MRRISILGSTGSIGCSTLDVISQQPDAFEMVALTAQNNAAKLIEQAKKFQPKAVVIGDEAHYETVKDALAATDIDVSAGAQALCDAAARPADLVMAAIVGVAGLNPTMAAIKTGASIAFASKECLVCAGDLMMDACKQSGSTLLPVDSEHNAIFQVFDFDQPDKIAKLTLTASGGPFRNHTAAQLASVTPEQAVAHPNWDMGAKISVD
jgi:1-deoxy-D-xylulose-5-phosphate reductoisomerase